MNRLDHVERRIARLLVLAQIASDAGKGYYDNILSSKDATNARRKGYSIKPLYLAKALTLMDSIPQGRIHYYVEACPDQNGYTSTLVTFDIKLNDCRYQMSFHNPGKPESLRQWIGKGRKTHWILQGHFPAPGNYRGIRKSNIPDSRETAKILVDFYDL